MMSYENMLFARELSLDKQRLENQAEKNKRIRNFNQTLSAMFDILGVTVNPLFALGGSVTEWLNPEKKYKTEYFLKDTVDALNRERKSNIPEWYNALLDVGTAYVGHKIGGEEIGKDIMSRISSEGIGKDIMSKLVKKPYTQTPTAFSEYYYGNQPKLQKSQIWKDIFGGL